MILLIDTCGAEGGVALAQLENGVVTIAGQTAIVGKTFAAELVPSIDLLLQSAHLSLEDLEAVAVVHGPGSFTGVRIGVSAAKGLVEAVPLPLIAVSRLAVLTRNAALPGRCIALFDAGRGEFYAGFYEDGICLREAVLDRNALLAATSDSPAAIVASEKRVAEALGDLAPLTLRSLQPCDAAPIAFERLLARQFDDPALLDANYLRRTDYSPVPVAEAAPAAVESERHAR